MRLSALEIRRRLTAFAKEWAEARSEAADAPRVAFLLGLYQRLTSLLPAQKTRSRREVSA